MSKTRITKRITKGLVSLLLVFAVMGSLFVPIPVFAANDYTEGSTDYTSWRLSEDGVLTVSPIGDSQTHPFESGIFEDDLRIKEVVIEEGITSVGDKEFSGCANVVKVTLPSTMRTIGYQSFCCGNLSSVNFSEGLTTIGEQAFRFCSKIERISLPASLKTIGSHAFNQCRALKEVSIPDNSNLESIGWNAFSYCPITEFFFPPTLTNLERGAFSNCKLTEVDLPDSITVIPQDCFAENYISDIVIGDNIVEVGNNAFKCKTAIHSIVIGSNVKKLGEIAQASNSDSDSDAITELTIPDNVEEVGTIRLSTLKNVHIGKNTRTIEFVNTANITTLTVDQNNPYLHVYDNVLYNSDYSKILYFNSKREEGTLYLPKELKEFDLFSNTQSFWHNVPVNRFEIEAGAEYFTTINGILYSKDEKVLHRAPPAYKGNITIPDSVEEIAAFAFFGLKDVDISFAENSHLKKIGDYAFRGYSHSTDTELVIPEGVNEIEENSFYTIGFTRIVFPDSLETIPVGLNGFGSFVKYIRIGKNTVIESDYLTYLLEKTKLEVPEDNPYYAEADGMLLSGDKSTVIYIYPDTTTVTLPKEVQHFNEYYRNFINGNRRTRLEVKVDEDNPYYKSDGIFLLTKDGKELVRAQDTAVDAIIPEGVEKMYDFEYASHLPFYTISNIKSVAFPDSYKQSKITVGGSKITSIDLPALKKMDVSISGRLDKVTFKEGLEEIRVGCKADSIIFPKSCKYISFDRGGGFTAVDGVSAPRVVINNPNTVFKYQGNMSNNVKLVGKCNSTAHLLAVKRFAQFEAMDHDYLDWYVSTPATYESEGVERRDCSFCDHYEERTIPKLVKGIHTATFMAEGKVVSKVEFAKGASKIEEPPVPEKDRYLGEWEDYTLGDEDIVINAKYTLIKAENAEDIDTESSVDYYYDTDDVLFNIKASSKAKTVKSTISQSVPLDIVLVVDQSGSMADTLGNTTTKKDALKNAANSFIQQVATNAQQTGANHRIAIAGFAMGNKSVGSYPAFKNTELLTTANGSIVQYNNLTNKIYEGSLLDVLVNNNLNENLSNAVNEIDADGATAADYGLAMAKDIFANNDSTDRERVVLFMTDGKPTYNRDFQTAVANSAIDNARVLKNTYGASVYSLGVFDTTTGSDSRVNDFMNAVSSDYPNATSLSKLGTRQSDAYYTTVSHTDKLSEVFRTITTESLSHTAAFDKLTIVKTLSKYVTLTSKQEQNLRVDLARKYGVTNDDITINRRDNGTTEIKIANLTPYEVDENGNVTYEVSLSFFASLNSNASAAGDYEVDTDDSGVILGDANGYEATFDTSSITLESDKTRCVYKINNEVYDICEGDAEPDISDFPNDWEFSGWSGNSELKTATLTKAQRTITWHTCNGDITQTYEEGSVITPPEAQDKSENEKFLSWNKSIPTVMPDENLEFTAVYGGHVHKYVSEVITPATCEEAGTTRYTCDCGDSYEETVPAHGHHYEAITASTDKDTTESSRCTFVCSNCGQRYSYALNYQVRESWSWLWSNMLFEFNLSDDNLENVSVQPDGTINIRIPLDETQYSNAKNVYVTRTENGKQIPVPAVIEDGYIVIMANHFSPYNITLSENEKPETVSLIYSYKVYNDDKKKDETKTVTKKVNTEGHTTEELVELNKPNIKSAYYKYGECKYEQIGTVVNVTIPNSEKKYKVILDGEKKGEYGYLETAEIKLDEAKSFIVNGEVVYVGKNYSFFVGSDTDITTEEPKELADYALIDLNNYNVSDDKVELDMLATANVNGKFQRMGVAFALGAKTKDEIKTSVLKITEGTATDKDNKIAVHNSSVNMHNKSGQYQFRYAPYFARDKAKDRTIYFYTYVVTDDGIMVSDAAQYDMRNLLA